MTNNNTGNIIVIEDDLITATLEKTILENAGYSVELFTLGQEGLDRISRGGVDLVLLDYMLPDMNGGEIIGTLGTRLKTLPVVVITGQGNELIAADLIKQGAADYLVKGMPNFVHVLTTTVKSAIDRFSLTSLNRDLEDKLKDSEKTGRRTFQALPDPAYVWQRQTDGKIVLTLINQAGLALMGSISENAIGKEAGHFFKNEAEINSNISLVIQKSQSISEERRCNLFYGEERWYNLDYVEFTKDGALLIAKDITSQKMTEEAQKQERDILESKVTERNTQLEEKNRELRAEIAERKSAEKSLRELSVIEELLATISSQFVASKELDRDIGVALKALGKGINSCRAFIYTFDSDGKQLELKYEWNRKGVRIRSDNVRIESANEIIPDAEKLFRGEMIHLPEVESLPANETIVRNFLITHQVKSTLYLPIFVHGELVGSIGFDHTKKTNPWTEDHIRLLKTASEIIGSAMSAMRDRQQLSESEEKYRNVVELASEGIIIVQDELVKYSNLRMAEIISWDLNTLIGTKLLDIIFRDETTDLEDFQNLQIQDDNSPLIYETALIDRNGEMIPVEFNYSLIRYNEAPAVMIFVRDITGRIELESKLRHAQKMESIGTLAAGIAHEINTPIQFVGDNMTFLIDSFKDIKELFQILEEVIPGGKVSDIKELETMYKKKCEEIELDYLIEEIPKAIEQSKLGANRVADIVRAMKTFAHPGPEEKIACDVNQAIESTVTVARNEWKYVADVETDLAPYLPMIKCLPGEVNQVFLNLIVNAAHAIEDANRSQKREKGKILIRTRQVDGFVEVSISDDGTGIPQKIRERIFDPFFTTKEVGKGTGQGLSIVHSVIVEKHGGKVDFDSEDGKGTTFHIQLPIGN